MAHVERIEREIADMKDQMKTIVQKEIAEGETQPKRSGFVGLIGAFIIGLILGILIGYLVLA